MFGFYRIASVVPRVYIADIEKNCENIVSLFKDASDNGANLTIFPELSLTSYSCKDLFFQINFLRQAEFYLKKILEATENIPGILVFGMPLLFNDALYNCAVVLQNGKILGIVPKQNFPNYKEFNEKRYFSEVDFAFDNEVEIFSQKIPFTSKIIFKNDADFSFGIEICEDFWSLTPPSVNLINNGASLICNLAASTEYVGKHNLRKQMISAYSNRCNCAYLMSSAGVGESVSDSVHAGHSIICENGRILVDNKPFIRENQINYADIDFQKITFNRIANSSYNSNKNLETAKIIKVDKLQELSDIKYAAIAKNPFLGNNSIENSEICREISEIQANALANRVEHIGAEKLVLGISGGLDSTLALLVCCNACKILGKNRKNILAVTMPGFGTGDRTYFNAIKLCEILGVDFKEINICESVKQHLEDIEHDINIHDVTYENSQARERTQILMDLSNKYKGLVVGTGDLSEIALGWCTYNGDHMSMYSVNGSIPKTLMRYIISEIAENSEEKLKEILFDIVNTPVSPELLPTDDNGEISQKTEDIIGPYELHDFFIYHFIKNGASPKKLEFLANQVFKDNFSEELIKKTLKTFIRRFFTQQFKRNCMPEGPKATEISLSPRGDWQMASEASCKLYLKELD